MCACGRSVCVCAARDACVGPQTPTYTHITSRQLSTFIPVVVVMVVAVVVVTVVVTVVLVVVAVVVVVVVRAEFGIDPYDA